MTPLDVVELFSLLVGTHSVEGFLTDLAQVAARTLDVSCELRLRRGRFPLTVVSSDARAAAVDDAQCGLGQGPCLRSLETGEIVSVPGPALRAALGRLVRARARVLLEATLAGVAAQPLTQVLEVPALRRRVRHVLGVVGHPQMLLRVGHGAAQSRSGRRPVEDVVSLVD